MIGRKNENLVEGGERINENLTYINVGGGGVMVSKMVKFWLRLVLILKHRLSIYILYSHTTVTAHRFPKAAD